MRNFGFVLLLAGAAGIWYCSQQVSRFEPLREGLSVEESLGTDRGKWEAGRAAAAVGAVAGVLLILMPQGRA